MPHVLVADSDSTSLQQLTHALEQTHYHVSQASNARDLLRTFNTQTPDLVLLETELSDQNGFEVCRRIRRTSDVPIMFISYQASAEDRVKGLKIGADDYLAKPCAQPEFLARINAVLRRAERARRPPTTSIVRMGWSLDPVQQVCHLQGGREVDLTPREVHLLSFLMKRSGRVCTNSQIIRHVWGYAGKQARSIVATSIWRLRAKLEDNAQMPRHLVTVRHVGYKFVE